jgi:hypothetical protein
VIDPLQQLLAPASLEATLYPINSRYHGIATAHLRVSDGRTIAYLRRRFVPQPESFALLHEHVVVQGDRLDNIAARYFGDAEQFWRVCDANRAIRPEELTERAGRKLRITLPQGVPGTPSA